MTPEFLRGFFTALLVEGVLLTVFWVTNRWWWATRDRCAECRGFLEPDGRGCGAPEKLLACERCGDTWPVGAGRTRGADGMPIRANRVEERRT